MSLLLEILGNVCIAIICYPFCDVINFEVKLSFFYQAVFLNDQKVRAKASWKLKYEILNILRTKRGFHKKKKAFFIIFKEFSLRQKKNLSGKWESDFRFALLNLVIQYWIIIRVSCLKVFWKIRVYKRSWELPGKYISWSGFGKVAGLETGSTLGVCLKPFFRPNIL